MPGAKGKKWILKISNMKKFLSCSNLVSLLSVILILLVCNFNLHAQQNKINTSERLRKNLIDNQLEKIDGVIKKEVWSQIDKSISELRQAKTGKSSLKSALATAAISEADSSVLVKLYNDTDGPNWTNKSNWLSNQPIRTWYGVSVVGDNITEIRLKENNLKGTIPAELGQLTSLEYLALDTNNLSGAIPTQLGNLSNLQFLHLDGNNLTGTIPIEFQNLTNLNLLYLADNQLSGSIPTQFVNLTNLIYLDLSDNQLTGSVPVQLGSLTNLEFLDLGSNLLTGNIPPELGQLPNMIWIDLRSNQFSGSIPNFGVMPNLRMLYLNSNNLVGSIPSGLAQLTNLVWLHLGQNKLTGSIPVELSQLTDLEQLYLDGNQLMGFIPTELGLLTNLIWLNLSQNQLTGSIPVEFLNLINLELLYLDNNQLTGSIPAEMGQISNLRWTFLNNNQLSGTIPDELGDLTNLEWLGLNDNQLTGSVPLNLTQLTNLLLLHLNGNQLDYLPEYTSPNNLTDLNVSNNKISFEDLEYNMNVLSGITFIYSPQDSIGESLEFTKNEGETLIYTLLTGGTQNSYQWYKDGVILPAQTTETLEIDNLTVSDAGNYYCEVTNTLVELTLTSREITLLLNICYTRNFSAGWNIFSSPVMPADPDMEAIFQPLRISESLIKIQDETGGSLEKISGNWNNNIGNMALTEGYKVKVNGDNNEIEICGPTVKYPYAIPLKLGWNIIGYPQTTAFDGKDVVQELIDKGVLIKIQDETGSSIEKLSDNWINNIGNFTVGKGYKIKVNAADTLWIYNSYPYIKSNTVEPELIPTAHYRPAFEGNGVDHMNIYLVKLSESGIMEGDEIGIYDGNICVGATKITKQNSLYINLIASAADGNVEKANGFRNGGDIILKLYRNGKEYPMSLQPVNNALLKFEKNGSVIAMANTDLTTAIEITGNDANVNFYPNPFNESINIEINLQNEEYLNVEIYDMYSRKIRQLHSSKAIGTIKLQWDGTDESGNRVATGVYFLRVNKTWKKVMLNGN